MIISQAGYPREPENTQCESSESTRFHPYYSVIILNYFRIFICHYYNNPTMNTTVILYLQNLSFMTITESPGCIKATPRWFSNKFLPKHFQLMPFCTVLLSGTFLYSTVLFNVFSWDYLSLISYFCKVVFRYCLSIL